MAGFSGIWPLVGGEDMQTIPAVLGELKIAYEERKNIIGLLVTGDPATDTRGVDYSNGDNLQTASPGPGQWQAWIEANYFWFIDTATGIEGNANEFLSPRYASLAVFRAAAGLNAAGFTRKFWKATTSNLASGFTYTDGSSPVNGDRFLAGDGLVYDFTAGSRVLVGACYGTIQPDTVTAFGTMRAGDFIYHHDVLNEIYRCFRLLTQIQRAADANSSTAHEGAAFIAASYAAMKSTAEANYNVNANNGFGPLVTWGGATESNYSTGSSWGGSVSGIRYRLTVFPPIATMVAFTATARFYAFAKAAQSGSGGVWDANGQNVLQDQWHNFDSAGGWTTATNVFSVFLGFDNVFGIPNWAPDASIGYVGPGVRNLYRGFDITSYMLTLDFGVPGGFDKY